MSYPKRRQFRSNNQYQIALRRWKLREKRLIIEIHRNLGIGEKK